MGDSETKICTICGEAKPLKAFEGKYKAECRTCADCREADKRRKWRQRVRVDGVGRALISGEALLGLPGRGLRVRPGRRRPRDGPGEVWLEVV